jgi:hypothetical protein
MPPSSPFSCRYSVAGYTEHMDERGEVRDPPPFEKVAEDWRDIGEQGRVGVAGMAAVMWLGRELWCRCCAGLTVNCMAGWWCSSKQSFSCGWQAGRPLLHELITFPSCSRNSLFVFV